LFPVAGYWVQLPDDYWAPVRFPDAGLQELLLLAAHSLEKADLAADCSPALESPASLEAPALPREQALPQRDVVSAFQSGPSADRDVPATLAAWWRRRRVAVAASPSRLLCVLSQHAVV
jgi:hypothetical protein